MYYNDNLVEKSIQYFPPTFYTTYYFTAASYSNCILNLRSWKRSMKVIQVQCSLTSCWICLIYLSYSINMHRFKRSTIGRTLCKTHASVHLFIFGPHSKFHFLWFHFLHVSYTFLVAVIQMSDKWKL